MSNCDSELHTHATLRRQHTLAQYTTIPSHLHNAGHDLSPHTRYSEVTTSLRRDGATAQHRPACSNTHHNKRAPTASVLHSARTADTNNLAYIPIYTLSRCKCARSCRPYLRTSDSCTFMRTFLAYFKWEVVTWSRRGRLRVPAWLCKRFACSFRIV